MFVLCSETLRLFSAEALITFGCLIPELIIIVITTTIVSLVCLSGLGSLRPFPISTIGWLVLALLCHLVVVKGWASIIECVINS